MFARLLDHLFQDELEQGGSSSLSGTTWVPSGPADPSSGGRVYGAGIGDASWKKFPSGSSNVASHMSAPSPGW